MSVLRIKAYHSAKAIENGLNYGANPEKTNLSESEAKGAYDGNADFEKTELDLNTTRAFTYSANSQKTNVGINGEVDLLITGIRCKPNLAAEMFIDDMNNYYAMGNKEDLTPRKVKRLLKVKYDSFGQPIKDENGEIKYFDDGKVYKDPQTGKCVYQEYIQTPEPRTAYMWVLSFAPESVLGYKIDPRLAHQIGNEFCNEFLGDYKCVNNTHMDKDHIHDHIMQCAYSIDGTHKYKDDMQTLLKAREVADSLSRKYGLPIILEPQTERGMSWFEWKSRHEGQSWKEQMRQDIRDTILVAKDFDDYINIMKQSGYELRITQNHITYTLPGDSGKKCRDTLLNKGASKGEDYTKTAIEKSFDDRQKENEITPVMEKMRSLSSIDPEKNLHIRHSSGIHVSRYTDMGRRRSDIEILLIVAIKILKKFADLFVEKDEKNIPQKDNPIYKPSAWKIQQMQDSLNLVQELGIGSMEELEKMINQSGTNLSHYKKQATDIKASADLAKDMLRKMDDMDDILNYIRDIGLTVDDLHLYTYDDKELRKRAAELSPMTDNQKKTLYVELEKVSFYKPKYKFDEMTMEEAQSVIDFLKGRTKEMPSVLVDLAEPNEDRLKLKYDKVFENRITGMKNKYSDKPLTKAQEKRLEKIFSGKDENIDPAKLELYQGVEIDTTKLSYYDAFRLISYFAPAIPLSSPVADTESIKEMLKSVADRGDKVNRDERYITVDDIKEIENYYKSNKKTVIPSILKDSPRASDAEIKQCGELLSLHNLKISIPLEAMSQDDARNLYTALLMKDRVPELLTEEEPNDKLKQDYLFEQKVASLPFDKQQAMIQARDMLNDLTLSGISPVNTKKKKEELEEIVRLSDEIHGEYEGFRMEYRNLARLRYNINLASRKEFIYGPLYDDEPLDVVEEKPTDNNKDIDREYEKKDQKNKDIRKEEGFKQKDKYFDRTAGVDI